MDNRKNETDELERAFKTALKEWLDAHPEETNIQMARFFFWAGGELGVSMARKIAVETLL